MNGNVDDDLRALLEGQIGSAPNGSLLRACPERTIEGQHTLSMCHRGFILALVRACIVATQTQA